MRPIPNETRKNIIDAKERGETIDTIIKWFNIGRTTIFDILRKYKKTGSYETIPFPGKQSLVFTKEINEKIKSMVKKEPSITQKEIIDELKLDITQPALSKQMAKLDLTLKKRLSMQQDYKEKMLLKEEKNLKKNKKI